MYRIAMDDGPVVEASIRGRLKKEERRGDRVVVGDRVLVHVAEDGTATVEEVEPRRTEICRRIATGRRRKVLAANVDLLVVVVAARDPEPSSERIDRLLVLAEANGVEGVVVVNKVDLPGAAEAAEELLGPYRHAGYRCLAVSASAGTGLDALRELLCSGTSVLAGPSGVGKSSLLNALEPSLALRTGELSGKVARGRHTTVASRLLPLDCGGAVVDTPGFSDTGVEGVDPGELDDFFPELRAHLGSCRFQDCAHVHEPGCAVREAVERGEVHAGRYGSYVRIRGELQQALDARWD